MLWDTLSYLILFPLRSLSFFSLSLSFFPFLLMLIRKTAPSDGRKHLTVRQQAIHEAASGRPDVGALDLLLVGVNDPFAADPSDGTTPLHRAALQGRCDALACLLAAGHPLHVRDARGNSALHCAVRNSRTNAVLLLLARGHALDLLNGSGDAALHIAHRMGDTELSSLLVRAGAASWIPNRDGLIPSQIIGTPSKRPAPSSQPPSSSSSSLSPFPSSSSHSSSLATRSNTPSIISPSSLSPFSSSSRAPSPPPPPPPPPSPSTTAPSNSIAASMALPPLDLRKLKPTRTPSMSKLFATASEEEGSSSPHSFNEAYSDAHRRLLQAAGVRYDLDSLRTLVTNVIAPFLPNQYGDTPLHTAAFFGKPDAVRLLIEHRHPVNVTNQYGYTPLNLAAEKNDSECVALLLEAGADPLSVGCELKSPRIRTTDPDIKAMLLHAEKHPRAHASYPMHSSLSSSMSSSFIAAYASSQAAAPMLLSPIRPVSLSSSVPAHHHIHSMFLSVPDSSPPPVILIYPDSHNSGLASSSAVGIAANPASATPNRSTATEASVEESSSTPPDSPSHSPPLSFDGTPPSPSSESTEAVSSCSTFPPLQHTFPPSSPPPSPPSPLLADVGFPSPSSHSPKLSNTFSSPQAEPPSPPISSSSSSSAAAAPQSIASLRLLEQQAIQRVLDGNKIAADVQARLFAEDLSFDTIPFLELSPMIAIGVPAFRALKLLKQLQELLVRPIIPKSPL